MLKILYNRSKHALTLSLNSNKSNVNAIKSMEPTTCGLVNKCNLNETLRVLYLQAKY